MFIPHITSNLAPLLTPSSTEPLQLDIQTTPASPDTLVYAQIAYRWILRFSIHLTLISLFETLFFWSFISKSEDTALISLIQGYTQDVLNSCANLTQEQRIVVRDVLDLFINQTKADAAAVTATTGRSAVNYLLFRNSWLYFGSILTIFTGVAVIGLVKDYKTDWRTLIAENLTLVTFLGLYEWMFFSTVVLRYQAISMPELDRMVVDEFQEQC